MYVLTSYLFIKHNLFQEFKMDPEDYFKFISHVQDNYNPSFIEYHNKTHGTDVCQTFYFFLKGGNLQSISNVSALELGSILIAAS